MSNELSISTRTKRVIALLGVHKRRFGLNDDVCDNAGAGE
jgi:hypothetical protein